MREFRSLSSRLFKENSPENLSVFSHSLEHYFFETKDANSRPERKFLTREIIPLAECEISQWIELTSIEPTMFHSFERTIAVTLAVNSSLLLMC